LNCEVTVQERRIEIDEIAHLIKYYFSPGPGIPEAGLLKEVIKNISSY
jgi:anthranilate/para-aminobenzoate synthase component II